MKEETIIDIEIRRRDGDRQVIMDRLKGLSPNVAVMLLEQKYTTKERKKDSKNISKWKKKQNK